MTIAFVETAEQCHRRIYQDFSQYRDTIADVLFYGKQISRSELCDRKDEVIRAIRRHIEITQQILFPALSGSNNAKINPVDVMAAIQRKLDDRLEHTNETIDYFANPDHPKEARNNAARESIKDLYRIDDCLKNYFELMEEIYFPAGDDALDEDEKQEFLDKLNSCAPA